VRAIAEKFVALIPTSRRRFRIDSKIEDLTLIPSASNANSTATQFLPNATHYTSGNDLVIVDPKAHGLGYLYPPKDNKEGPDWTHDAWIGYYGTARIGAKSTAMMRIVLSTRTCGNA